MDHIYGYANFQLFVVSLALGVFAPTFKPWKTSLIFQTFYHYKVNYFNYFFSYSGCDNL